MKSNVDLGNRCKWREPIINECYIYGLPCSETASQSEMPCMGMKYHAESGAVKEEGKVEKMAEFQDYKVPKEYLDMMTDDFLKAMRGQLFRIFKGWGLNSFAEEHLDHVLSTSGWYCAFGKACLMTGKEELFDYYRMLNWYESDSFDWELELLLRKGYLLGNVTEVIKQQLGIDSSEIRECCDCGKLFQGNMVVQLSEKEAEENMYPYRCFHCQDLKDTPEENRHTTKYYRDSLEELDAYKKANPLPEKSE